MVAVVEFPERRGRRRGAVSPQAIEVAERGHKAMALRRRGFTLEAIATELGYADRSGARKAIERGLAQWMHQGVEDFRAAELENTELLLDRLWPLVDCDTPDLKAMDRILKLMEHRAKIAGLYAKRESPPDTYPGAPNPAANEKVEQVNTFIELINLATGGELNAGFGHNPGPNDENDEDDDDRARPARHYELTVADELADDEPAQEEPDDDDDDDDDDFPDDAYWVDGKLYVDREVDGKLVRLLVESPSDQQPQDRPRAATNPPPPISEGIRPGAFDI